MNFFYTIIDYEFRGNQFKKEYVACLKEANTGRALEKITTRFRLYYRDVDIKDISIRRLSQEYEWIDETYKLIYRGD